MNNDASRARTVGLARSRILERYPFWGQLLLHMRYGLDDHCGTVYTDGECIMFGQAFLDPLSFEQVKFVLLHEILHVVLGHCFRQGERDNLLFDIACDIVVNANIMQEAPDITPFDGAMHLAPDGKPGNVYSAEEVYAMLVAARPSKPGAHEPRQTVCVTAGVSAVGSDPKPEAHAPRQPEVPNKNGARCNLDDHSKWGKWALAQDSDKVKMLRELWRSRMVTAARKVQIWQRSHSCGLGSAMAERVLHSLKQSQTDWRTLLRQFVQQETYDFGFSPPDKRFHDSPFCLPDWNERREKLTLWFCMDTSGSISDYDMTQAWSELWGAVQEFNGLDTWISFFDSETTPPKQFQEEDILKLKPVGGGGTSFDSIFKALVIAQKNPLLDFSPDAIVILTDGEAQWPDESASKNIPVLWLINNEEIMPPWGQYARLKT